MVGRLETYNDNSEKRGEIMSKLKPCPFCGKSIAVAWCNKDWLDFEKIETYAVSCDMNEGGCGGSSGFYETKEEAIEAWNRRTNDE